MALPLELDSPCRMLVVERRLGPRCRLCPLFREVISRVLLVFTLML